MFDSQVGSFAKGLEQVFSPPWLRGDSLHVSERDACLKLVKIFGLVCLALGSENRKLHSELI